jgi:hypothetical protein
MNLRDPPPKSNIVLNGLICPLETREACGGSVSAVLIDIKELEAKIDFGGGWF